MLRGAPRIGALCTAPSRWLVWAVAERCANRPNDLLNRWARLACAKLCPPYNSRIARPPVHLVGTALESERKSPERGIEHRAHQHREHAALEFIGDEVLHVAKLLAGGVEGPAVLHSAERAVQILDEYLQVGAIERDPAGEGLAQNLVGNGHIGNDRLDPLPRRGALAHAHVLTQRHEFRIVLHVGDKVEHVGGGMTYAPPGAELRHQAREARAAFSRAKSSPA